MIWAFFGTQICGSQNPSPPPLLSSSTYLHPTNLWSVSTSFRSNREASRWFSRLTRSFRRLPPDLQEGVIPAVDPVDFDSLHLWKWHSRYTPRDNFRETTSWKLKHDLAQLQLLVNRDILRDDVFAPVMAELDRARKLLKQQEQVISTLTPPPLSFPRGGWGTVTW